MSKNIIDHIVADKLNNVNFDFKAEYWDKMQNELDANCTQTNTCSSSSISGFLSGSLITVFVAVISIILLFPWAIDQTPVTTTICGENFNQEVKLIADSNSGQTINTKDVIVEVQPSEEVNIEPVTKSNKASVNSMNAKKHRKIKISTKDKVTPIKKTSIKNQGIANQMAKPEDKDVEELLDKQVTESESTMDSAEKITVEQTEPKQKENVTYETDSINIPDAKLLGNDKEDVDNETKVDVNAGPKPVKHVKTKSKPIKRVFKKRKGILYKLGIRK